MFIREELKRFESEHKVIGNTKHSQENTLALKFSFVCHWQVFGDCFMVAKSLSFFSSLYCKA